MEQLFGSICSYYWSAT